jgi:hypothetical protein
MNSELSQAIPAWRFPGIIRGDLVVYNSVVALGRATAEQVDEDMGEELKALGVLEAEKDKNPARLHQPHPEGKVQGQGRGW